MPSRAKNSRFPVLGQLTACLFIVAALASGANARAQNTDPGNKDQTSIGGISFSRPSGFTIQHTDSTYLVAYMRHDREDLALFVAIPPGAGDEYTDHLGGFLASYLFPQEWAVFAWKHVDGHQKVGKFETRGGRILGFNGAQVVLLEYSRLQVGGTEVIAGYLVGAGRDEHAAEASGRSLAAGSPAGRSGVAQVIASITGEKHADLITTQDSASNTAQPGNRTSASKPFNGLKEFIQATLSGFRAQKIDLPTNFSMAVTFSVNERGEPANLSVAQSSGSKVIDEAALEILRRAGESGVLGMLHGPSSIRMALELTPATAHSLITWSSADEQQAADSATKLSFLVKLLAAQQRKKSPAAAELLALIRCRPDGKLVVIEMTAPRERWAEWTRTWLGATPARFPTLATTARLRY